MTIPDELRRSAPRSVSLTATGWKAALGFCFLPVLVLVIGAWLELGPVRSADKPTISGPVSPFSPEGIDYRRSQLSRTTAGGPPTWLQPHVSGWALLFTAISLWRIRKERRLLVHGRAVIARTTTGAVARTKPFWPWNRSTRQRVQWLWCEFPLFSGGVCRAQVNTWNDPRLRTTEANTEMVLLYDPDEPKKAMLYPTRLLKVVRH